MKNRTVAIVGCGAIGRAIAKAFSDGRLPGRVTAVCDLRPEAAERLAASIRPVPHITTVEGAVRAASVVVECASVNAVDPVVRAAARHRRDVVVMSEIGLMGHPELFDVVRRAGISMAVPSGALAGLDALRAASGAKLKSVKLTTRKPPAGLESAPYVVRRGINLRGLKKPLILYNGNVIGAAKGFPANINVAAGCALAGIGPKATRVCIIADPTTTVNSHTLEYEGEFGRAVCRIENRPFPENPKTSYLAALSAISALRRMLEGIGIGG